MIKGIRAAASQALCVLRGVVNPVPVFLDWAGLIRRPYLVRTRGGAEWQVRPGRGDRYALFEVALRGDYLWHSTLNPGDTVIDIGANVGIFSVLAAQAVGPAGRVIAIEPEVNTFAMLCANVRRNQLGNVRTLQQAVGGGLGEVTFHVSENRLFSSVYTQVDGHATGGAASYTVQTTTLEHLMSQEKVERCHLLKVDCEGAEYEIFAALSPETAARIYQIVMEVHQVPGRAIAGLLDRLAHLGFRAEMHGVLYARRA